MFLVFPEIVEPSLGPNGWPRLPHETTETVMKPMLGCFASIFSDKREGAPARHSSICGYHDQCRLHILPSRHIDKIRQLIAHFESLEYLIPWLTRYLMGLWWWRCFFTAGGPITFYDFMYLRR